MKNESDLLFVYGTLLMQENEFARYLRENGSVLTKGRIKGSLYDLGQYPGAVYDPGRKTFVHGMIIKMNNPVEVLNYMDDYEGIGEPHCEYIRTLVEVETEAFKEICWMYLYILSEENLNPIPGGNYLEHRKSPER